MIRRKKKVVKPRVVRTRNAGKLTEAMYFQMIRQALRDKFRYWEPARIALMKASRPYRGKNKLQKTEFQCAECKHWFKRTQVHIDHIIECGSLNCLDDIKSFIERLTPEDPNAYQVLCIPHHVRKTKKYKQSKIKSK